MIILSAVLPLLMAFNLILCIKMLVTFVKLKGFENSVVQVTLWMEITANAGSLTSPQSAGFTYLFFFFKKKSKVISELSRSSVVPQSTTVHVSSDLVDRNPPNSTHGHTHGTLTLLHLAIKLT